MMPGASCPRTPTPRNRRRGAKRASGPVERVHVRNDRACDSFSIAPASRTALRTRSFNASAEWRIGGISGVAVTDGRVSFSSTWDHVQCLRRRRGDREDFPLRSDPGPIALRSGPALESGLQQPHQASIFSLDVYHDRRILRENGGCPPELVAQPNVYLRPE